MPMCHNSQSGWILLLYYCHCNRITATKSNSRNKKKMQQLSYDRAFQRPQTSTFFFCLSFVIVTCYPFWSIWMYHLVKGLKEKLVFPKLPPEGPWSHSRGGYQQPLLHASSPLPTPHIQLTNLTRCNSSAFNFSSVQSGPHQFLSLRGLDSPHPQSF